MDAHDRLTRQIVEALKAHLAEGRPLAIPEAGRLIWGWFGDLHATRTYGDAGPHAIAFAEIAAYAALMRWPIEPRHVVALRTIDDAWIRHARSSRGDDRAPGLAVTADLFDALFA